ncbi:Uncharacterised protein [Nocardia africana]|uniref:Uncharacterized protein n=1 Tax=Nocardia africana TaxID=134964 RepID=A0A378WYM9_9NOCA|nr:Uncharacterised protein [Nocardia africana]
MHDEQNADSDAHDDEPQKRGGYAAPRRPFELPRSPAGPAQGAESQTSEQSTTAPNLDPPASA